MKAAERVEAVRAAMRSQALDGLIVPRADEHLGEYVPPSAERLGWLTGFTGSAGLAVVLMDRAAVFSDGRYVLQLEAQTDGAVWERRHMVETPAPGWLASHTVAGARIGYDPMLVSEDGMAAYASAGLTLVPVLPNPVDVAWVDRPAPPQAETVPQPMCFAGKTSSDKRQEIAAALAGAELDAAVVTDPASIAWLLNIRGGDVAFTPFALAFLLMAADGTATLFIDEAKLPGSTREWLGNGVLVRRRDELEGALERLGGRLVGVDAAGSPAWFAQRLRVAGATVRDTRDPILLPKARKNATEQDGARAAHRRDAVALCRFLHWMEGAAGQVTELGAAKRLLAYRAEAPEFRGESFPAISAAGEHAAIMHYRVIPETDRPVGRNEVYLIDSGGQYQDGTTDVTRTLWTGPDPAPEALRRQATLVLKGHIAIATAVFPEGVAGPHLDALARRALWAQGLDFDHGTGHGVGSYLSVHEGPVSLSRNARVVPIAEGMILSDEPGYYEPGAYGIRLENLLLVQQAALPAARKPFLRFETLTFAPFDARLIDALLLDAAERAWLSAYHAEVLTVVGPSLSGADRQWLERACFAC